MQIHESKGYSEAFESIALRKTNCKKRGMESWVNFKYECLPNICYWCERLIHHDKDYLTLLKKRGADKDEEKQFSSWLRASTPNPS